MIVKIDQNNPIRVETLDGKVLFDFNPVEVKPSNLTEKYFLRLQKEIELQEFIAKKGWRN